MLIDLSRRDAIIRHLVAAGYTPHAIAARLRMPAIMLGRRLTKLGIGTRLPAPPGYISMPEAAKRAQMTRRAMRRHVERNTLRYVTFCRRHLTTIEWLDIWQKNQHYRLRARELAFRAFCAQGAAGDGILQDGGRQ